MIWKMKMMINTRSLPTGNIESHRVSFHFFGFCARERIFTYCRDTNMTTTTTTEIGRWPDIECSTLFFHALDDCYAYTICWENCFLPRGLFANIKCLSARDQIDKSLILNGISFKSKINPQTKVVEQWVGIKWFFNSEMNKKRARCINMLIICHSSKWEAYWMRLIV